MSARANTGASGPCGGDHTGIAEVDYAADPQAALARHLADDDGFHAAFARAGGPMLGVSRTAKLHVFESGQQASRCGLLLRPEATISTHRTDVEAIEAGADLCRMCCRDQDEIAAALAERRTP